MRTRTKVMVVAGAAALVAGAIATVSVATGGGDPSLTGSVLGRATEAALRHTGGVSVVESEAGEGSAAYEVAVLLEDGRVVEVQLDDDFRVTGSGVDAEPSVEPGEADESEEPSDEGGADDGS
ncbi:MAG TPA: hypothetical protein VF351_05545 [Actinomycetota bacterium]